MEKKLTRLAEDYYDGKLSRRQLMTRLAAYGVGTAGMAAAAFGGTAAAQESGSKPTIGELLKDNLNKQFFIGFMNVNEGFRLGDPETMKVLVDHLLFLFDLEERGILFMAGPLRDGKNPSSWNGSGIAIIRAESAESAEKIFSEEPFAKAGLRTNSVSGWQLNEGSFQATIRFATGTYEIG